MIFREASALRPNYMDLYIDSTYCIWLYIEGRFHWVNGDTNPASLVELPKSRGYSFMGNFRDIAITAGHEIVDEMVHPIVGPATTGAASLARTVDDDILKELQDLHEALDEVNVPQTGRRVATSFHDEEHEAWDVFFNLGDKHVSVNRWRCS